MVGWLVSYLFIDIYTLDCQFSYPTLFTLFTLFTLGGTLYLKKGIETSLIMISWEAGEGEDSILYYTGIGIGIGNDVVKMLLVRG